MKIKYLLSGLCLIPTIVIPTCVTSCTGGDSSSKVQSLTITSPNNANTVNVNSSLQLSVSAKPDGADTSSIVWTSSNESVATVSSTGLVKGISMGSADITAATSDGSVKSNTFRITVVKDTSVKIENISLTPVYVAVDGTTTCNHTITPYNASNNTILWSVGDESIAKVDQKGVVTGVSAGQTTLTATATDGSGVTAQTDIYVTLVEHKITSINLSNVSVVKGQSTKAYYTILPSNATNTTLNWTTGSSAIASVSSSGYVTGNAIGTTTLTATATDGSGITATSTITVTEKVVSTETPEEFIQNRTFSIAGGDYCGTAWILADATPTIYNDYKYYLATNYHVWYGFEYSEDYSTFDIYLADGKGTKSGSDYKTVSASKYSVLSQSKFYYSDSASQFDHTGIDFTVLQVDLSGISSFQTKLDKLNEKQKNEGVITPFTDPTTDSQQYISSTMYTGGYPAEAYDNPTWEYHDINTSSVNMKYHTKNYYGHDASGALASYRSGYKIKDISPQYRFANSQSPNWMSAGASGSMLVGDYDGELKVAGIYWGGQVYPEVKPYSDFWPMYSIIRSNYADFYQKIFN